MHDDNVNMTILNVQPIQGDETQTLPVRSYSIFAQEKVQNALLLQGIGQ